MPVSSDFVAYVTEQLAPFARITSRRMFGGVGLYANVEYAEGLFFAIIDDDTLYFKVDDSNRADYDQRGSRPFCPFPDKAEFTMAYYNVPADLLEEGDDLCRWARKSVAVALIAANKKIKRRPKKAQKAKQSLTTTSFKKKSVRKKTATKRPKKLGVSIPKRVKRSDR